MASASSPIRRCAIYTRKSSEEGLDQDFNSLDAQREACEAYIKSQVGEGWKMIPARYDDGGFSGGSMDRPGLARLLGDIQDCKIDTVVVYKVDRLTRSLADFAKIVEVFDAQDVSFVSVTQQFNTTTSMGRLTLNMLLSFAQFEREVTGERIRDKIAASKKKGMWMGGFVPLGYEPDGRTLVINEKEAETVRAVFRLYLEFGNVRRVKEEADRLGFKTKSRTKKNGGAYGGWPLSRGYIYKVLSNPLYAGRISHKGQSYDGLHPSIIAVDVWDAVQAKLSDNVKDRRSGNRKSEPSALIGKLFDETGSSLTPSHAKKPGRRYRYYVSKSLIMNRADQQSGGWRLPAREIENTVVMAITSLLADRAAFVQVVRDAGVPQEKIADLLNAVDACQNDPLRIFSRVDLASDHITLSLDLERLTDAAVPIICHSVPMCIKRRGVEMRLVINSSNAIPKADFALIKAIVRAHDWWNRLISGQETSMKEMASRDRLSVRYIRDILPLVFLAPDITERILKGSQPRTLCLAQLTRARHMPLNWDKQRRMLGFD
jgi:site-specific DNA recombinase